MTLASGAGERSLESIEDDLLGYAFLVRDDLYDC
jgi:hypothetical protein